MPIHPSATVRLHLHRVADFVQSATCDSAGSTAAIFDDIVQVRGVLGKRGAGLPDGGEAFDHSVGHQLLAVDTADGGSATVSIDLLDHRQR